MIRTYLIWHIIALGIPLVSTIPFDQPCTFSSDRCLWDTGRRWAIGQFDEEIDDQVLMAMGHSEDDERLGYTDSIATPWLPLAPICAFQIRLAFLFNIENEHDRVEAFLWKRNGTRISSLGHWNGLSNVRKNVSGERESHWQQANLTFPAAEQFRIEIEVRHRPDDRNESTSWFAIDDLLIQRCPNGVQVTSTKPTPVTTVRRSQLLPSYRQAQNWTGSDRSFYRFRWKFNDSTDSPTDDLLPAAPRFTFLNVVLYICCALVGLVLLIVLLAIIISSYRKYCLPPPTSSPSVIHCRYRSSRKKKSHRLNKHSDHQQQGRDTRTEKTMITTLRTYTQQH